MNEQTQKLIEQLASKLGVTVEHLWGVLIHQAPISSGIWALEVVLGIITGGVMLKKSITLLKQDDEDGLAIGLVCGGVVLVLFAVIFMAVYSDQIMAGFFNPEYWALRQILK